MIQPINKSAIKYIIQSILRGLNFIHENKIIHRDLKPSNILINNKFDIKIGDFGSAIKISEKVNNQFEIEGFTTWYKAPELLFGYRDYSFEIDL